MWVTWQTVFSVLLFLLTSQPDEEFCQLKDFEMIRNSLTANGCNGVFKKASQTTQMSLLISISIEYFTDRM